MSTPPDIADLLLAWEDSVAQGHEASPEWLCRDNPELLEELERRIETLRAMQWMAESGGETVDAPDVRMGADPPKSLGRYRLE